MDPTTKKRQIPTISTTITALSTPPPSVSDPHSFSTLCRLKPGHHHHPIHSPSQQSNLSKASDPSRFHSLLNFKSLTLSADAESHCSLAKRQSQRSKKQQRKGEVETQKRPIKENHKIKPSGATEETTREAEQDPKRVSVSLVSGERRRSFCGDAKIELSSFFSGVGARVVAVDMPPFMQIHAVSCARKTYDALDKMSSKTLACALKKEFDGVYGPAWHCIVGSSFGSFVTHSVGGFMYFSLDHKLYVLLFKTSVQRAD